MKSNVTRREFLAGLAAAGALADFEIRAQQRNSSINRFELVNRHNPIARKIDSLSPLSIGNGEFAFTSDVTGLQTFPGEYAEKMPLCTMSQWGWHTTPSAQNFKQSDLRLTEYDTRNRKVGYATRSEGQKELFDWLRQNPHRLHLGQIGWRILKSDKSQIQPIDVTDSEQKLDLWTGSITSRFRVENKIVTVKTTVHPLLDLLAVSVESDLINDEKLAVRFNFPYGSPEMNAADWTKSEKHQSKIVNQTANRVEIERKLDADQYSIALRWSNNAVFKQERAHEFVLTPQPQNSRFEFVVAFAPGASPSPKSLPSAQATFVASAEHWKQFWTSGGAIELGESEDKRALELERRIVLSQYLTAINCAGSLPPQETGLTVNSWYGKFHLEMHWWHAAHFALWNRLPLFEKSLVWYAKVLPSAQERAKQQGYAGARWAKMTATDGRDAPSPIGPLLIWQQPHPIFYAELCYQSHPNRATLEKYRAIVAETAEFMASYAFFEAKNNRYVLGPPVIPAQENHPAPETWNPTYELEYWRFGLNTANLWRERLGLKRNLKWDDVVSKLSKLPVKDGVYLAHENCPQTFTERNRDHPSMLAAYGVLRGEMVDRETMRATLKKVMKEWQWAETWGWDYPMTAMTAAKLGETETAIDALLLDTPKNVYLPNGHNYQRPNLPLYLPGNGGLLYAVALMAAGWRDAPNVYAPGFPKNSWKIRSEGLNKSLMRQML